jgi:hypothetical protein
MAWSWNLLAAGAPPGGVPAFVDVGCPRGNPAPFSGQELYTYWAGWDGSLWRYGVLPAGEAAWQQVSAPGSVTRVGVAPDGTVWCVTKEPAAAYYLSKGDLNGSWTPVSLLANAHPYDVDVATDGSVRILMTSGEYWGQTSDGKNNWYFTGVPLAGLTGFDPPVSLSDPGRAWGIWGSTGHSGPLCFCNHVWVVEPEGGGGTFIGDVVDISTSPNYLWMVKSDDTVWTSTTGTTQTRIGENFFAQRICGAYIDESQTPGGEVAFAVAKDGSPWTYSTR